ncbi:MAG: hypothetical protein RLZZ163_353 [Actinomycetota bacterium]|jgi:hypothetical protein
MKAAIKRLIPAPILLATAPSRERVRLRMRKARLRMRKARVRLYPLIPPRTLNSKIRYRMLYDRNPLLTTFCDKWAVREYVANRVGSELLTAVYAIVSDPSELDVDALPNRCVIKPTHGSGAVIIVDERADPDSRIPSPVSGLEWTAVKVRVTREQLHAASFRVLTRSWLSATYAKGTEPGYLNVPPRLIVEELLEDARGAVPPDIRFFCVNGSVRFITHDLGWAPHVRRAVLSPRWELLGAQIHYPKPKDCPRRPDMLDKAIVVAERLAEEIDFIRVDLYVQHRRVVFGELTPYHAGGNQRMTPLSFFVRVASDWRPHRETGPYRLGMRVVQR